MENNNICFEIAHIDIFTPIIDIIDNVVENIHWKFTNKHLLLTSINPKKTLLVNYEINNEYMVFKKMDKSIEFSSDSNDLLNVLKLFMNTTDTITFSINSDEPNYLILEAKHNSTEIIETVETDEFDKFDKSKSKTKSKTKCTTVRKKSTKQILK